MSIVRALLLGSGAVLVVTVVAKIGPAAVLESFAHLSWWLPVVLVFPFVVMTMCDTLGWKFSFAGGVRRVPFFALLGVRMAGEAFSMTTPTASVGGEAVKAWLLRPYVALEHSLPSVIVAKTTITAAQALFLAAGLAVALWSVSGDSVLLVVMGWLVVLEIVGVAGFILVQISGIVGTGAHVLHRALARLGVRAAQAITSFEQVDGALARFYRDEPLRLLLSVAFHFLGWALGALEVYVILNALGTPVSLTTAVLIEAFGSGVRFASFMIPAHLGVLEAGHVGIFVALGLPAPLGLAFSLVRRVREGVWIVLGFLALAVLRLPQHRPERRPAPGVSLAEG